MVEGDPAVTKVMVPERFLMSALAPLAASTLTLPLLVERERTPAKESGTSRSMAPLLVLASMGPVAPWAKATVMRPLLVRALRVPLSLVALMAPLEV